ncbi:MAG: D-mannonate oxidoreductase [Ardenticatenia bacterium]|nr:MAG: D-mannonate oxidoreductase [Ardenticatenia bacterium]
MSDITRMYDFTDHIVLITGGAGMLGGEMACALASLGANVVILDRDPALADRLMERLNLCSGRALVVYGDVLKRDTLIKADEVIRSEFGDSPDMLINAAGGNNPRATTGPDKSFFDIGVDDLRFVFDLNAIGTIVTSQVFGRRMAEKGYGVILNVSSMNAFRPLTRVVAYSAAKAAVTNFTQWLAVHMAKEYSPNIRVNAIAPGFMLTEQNRYLLIDQETGELTPRGRAIIEHTPQGRFGTPEDLLGTVLWLLSPASAHVTGIVVPVDGGFSAFSGV